MEHDLDPTDIYDIRAKFPEFNFPPEIEGQSRDLQRCRRCGAYVNPDSDSLLTKACPGEMKF